MLSLFKNVQNATIIESSMAEQSTVKT